MAVSDIKTNPLILKVDNTILLNIINEEEVEIDNDITKKVIYILNRTILDSSDGNINISYDDISYILKSATSSQIVSLKTDLDTNVMEQIKEILKIINAQNKAVGVILNFRLNENFDILILFESIEYLVQNSDDSFKVIWSTTVDNMIDDVELTAIISV